MPKKNDSKKFSDRLPAPLMTGLIAALLLLANSLMADNSAESKAQVLSGNFEILAPANSETNGWPVEIKHIKSGIELIYVAPGEFVMGEAANEEQRAKLDADITDGNSNDVVPHKVILTKPFYIGKYEVTQQQWGRIKEENPSHFSGDQLPVEKVNWNEAIKFCRKLGKGFRLPTEAEWEYACRGGQLSKGYKYSGSNDLDAVAWHKDNSDKQTHPVGQKQANELGLYDMSGNVWEWCLDWYADYPPDGAIDPRGPAGASYRYRVDRGGAWSYRERYCQSIFRYSHYPYYRYYDIGFRVCYAPPQQAD